MHDGRLRVLARRSVGLRDAIMQAFRPRGIKPSNAAFFTEEALRWPIFTAERLATTGPTDLSLDGVRAFVETNAHALGVGSREKLDVYLVETSRITAPDDSPQITYFTQTIARSGPPRGATLVFEGSGRLRYVLASSRDRAARARGRRA